MAKITQIPAPDDSFLHALACQTGAYADCFEATVACDIPQSDAFQRFVFAFFDSPVFRVERAILRLAGKAPKDRSDPKALALGETDAFAAWRVERRADNEILLVVLNTPIRTWLSLQKEGSVARLRFGSAILPQEGKDIPHWAFRVTLPAHVVYSRLLLRAAVSGWARATAKDG
ncbi:MAG: hypothetical protein AAFN44_06750 [Pseudomonadota bacterium]